MVEKFLKEGNHDSKSRLFRWVSSTKKGVKRDPRSNSRAAELIKAELRKEGLDPALYGIHSLRAGGATTAAALSVCFRGRAVGAVTRHGITILRSF